jgi:HAD superfamily hydrolase (TIGR01450 family)
MIKKYNTFIFDLDGTIYLDDKLIDNAKEVINKIKYLQKNVIFISNKTTGLTTDYYNFLKSSGLNIICDDIISATITTKNYLKKKHLKENFFAIGEQVFIDELKESGLNFVSDPNIIDVVIITLDRTLNYSKLEIAAKALDKGARFYAANIDNTCPVEKGEILDAGSTISALEKRTNRKLEKHFGKPSKYMLEEIFSRVNVNPKNCIIIGDRLETDIAMGNKFGIDTALVMTGIKKNLNLSSRFKPTYHISSIADLIK